MIIFEGDEIVVHYHAGKSSYLLISFIGAYHEHEASSLYLMRDYVEGADITCLGFTSKIRNFYVSEEIDAAIAAAEHYTRQYETVVVIGQSMGGYGCLKYSRRLGATHVLSASPFYSLDPDDMKITHTKHMRYYHAALKEGAIAFHDGMLGMRIREEDCSGKVLIAFDPTHKADSYNAELCLQHSGDAYPVPLIGIGHATIFNLIRETPFLDHMLQTLIRNDGDKSRRELKRYLSTNYYILTSFIWSAIRKKPLLCLRALTCDRVRSCPDYAKIKEDDALNYVLVHELSLKGLDVFSYAHLLSILFRTEHSRLQNGLADVIKDIEADGASAAEEFLLLSQHGTFLAFDVGDSRLVLIEGLKARSGIALVRLGSRNDVPVLLISVGNRELHLELRHGLAVLSEKIGVNQTIMVGSGRAVSLYDPEAGFLTARADMTVNTNAIEIHGWERFAMIPVIVGGGSIAISSVIDRFAEEAGTSDSAAGRILPALEQGIHGPVQSAPERASLTWLAKQSARNAFVAAGVEDLPVLLGKVRRTMPRAKRKWGFALWR